MKHIKDIYDELGWENADGYPAGTKSKILRDEKGAKTILLKLPEGFRMEGHSHLYNEQHLVLQGGYESEGVEYQAGAYRLIHAGNDHGPFTSRAGAIVLIIWDPIY